MPKATRKHRSNPEWLRRHLTDPYVRKSVQEGYRSRAAYKLIEIDDKDRLLAPGMTVVDLGAAPGSWTQVISRRLTHNGAVRGRIVALDLLPMEALPGVDVIEGDFREESIALKVGEALGGKADTILSDMAPNLSGVAAADAARCLLLAELSLDFARQHLKADGSLLIKAFQGSGHSQFVEALKRSFQRVVTRKPGASRESSAEIYLLARELRPLDRPGGS